MTQPPPDLVPTPSSLQVALDARSYTIRVGRELSFDDWSDCPIPEGGRALLVSDETVAALYGETVCRGLERRGVRVARVVVPPGESSKALGRLAPLYAAAAAGGLDRQGTVVALGGGVVGDLAGFVAATYLRGVRLVQIPTTLLAMVDSSVGGKTGVNLPEGKNLVGAFHQPAGVLIGLSTLGTLPPREFAAGLAEVVKYGAIRDAALLTRIEREAAALSRSGADVAVLGDLVARCCRIKAEVVAADEREAGERAILNFGHTLGHALEKTLGYGVWLHGEAVALGMVYAARLAEHIGRCPTPWSERLAAILNRFGLPTTRARLRADTADAPPDWEALRSAMGGDKKSRGGTPRFVLCDAPGRAEYGVQVDEDALRAVWEAMP